MPKRTDIKKILLIGSGPIIIGQGCEFDYSGVQACKALKKEGYEVVLVNSNPATIMTDPDFADRTYIEPLSADIILEIIRRERPDALLATLGGQTALNLAMELSERGILKKYRVEMIGATAESINRAEDRAVFKQTMQSIGLELPKSISVHTLAEAIEVVRSSFDSWPLIIRAGYTLGGTGGGIARNESEFIDIVSKGLAASKNSEVLIEESLLGWKEYELEVMRDKLGNCVIVCSIENFDPMGIHTGDSITAAPILTLSDKEYQLMRDKSMEVMKAIGVETGGSNVQWAVEPSTGRQVIIEMNPRVSRSSALASKATGFPIAKIAALLAVGYTLDEIRNDITAVTPACFEPAIDYIVTKVPRFTFEKFPKADPRLGTQMKSVGEAMAIGRTFKESFQKALRSLETGRAGFGADGKDRKYESAADSVLEENLISAGADRVFYIRAAFKRAWSVDRVYELTKIDRFFLRHLEELANYEAEIASVETLEGLKGDIPLFIQAKQFGYSDKQIAYILKSSERQVRLARKSLEIFPTFSLVDTCAGEFEAFTPYYFSTYSPLSAKIQERQKEKRSIIILGGGPNRIGQGIEFDYCCVHAAFALKKAGYESIMINSNPETVSTDYDTSDKLYFEPLTAEDVMHVYEKEGACGVIVQFGGQTPLNLAAALEEAGAAIIGTSTADIELAEDRDYFQKIVDELDVKQAPGGIALNAQEAAAIAERIGYPVLVRPSFVLGGRGMEIAYSRDRLIKYVESAVEDGLAGKPILIDKFLEDAIEVDVDSVSDGKTTVIGAIMEHVEPAGIHSGDSASMIPTSALSPKALASIRAHCAAFAKRLNVRGLMNIQLAVANDEVFVIEVNPRASRTVPFAGKSTGVALAQTATLCMLGKTLEECNFTEEKMVRHYSVKEAVLPFIKFPGADILLTPEMRSTGEVMGIDRSPGLAHIKSQIAAGSAPPETGNLFISLRDKDKRAALSTLASLYEMGFTIYATLGTSTMLRDAGIPSRAIFRISQGRPNIIDMLENDEIHWIITTTEPGEAAITDEMLMRTKAVTKSVPITTTLAGFIANVHGIREKREFGRFEVCTLQEYHKR
ncbi:MAG: carbamoyl-phosphate synthase large subunit [Deferribacteraceae bacterium]|jgi:carbamoyl-phosphate synthase large subunit|nr:carbamoyl-phosphate synthase large subunit [Deferribacteraceae bacterium]